MLQRIRAALLTAQICDRRCTLEPLSTNLSQTQLPLSQITNGLLLFRFFLDMVPSKNRTKAVEDCWNEVIQVYEFQSSRFKSLSDSVQPLDNSTWNFGRTSLDTHFQKFGLMRSATKGRECQKNFRVKTFLANLDPQHHVSPMGIFLECHPCQDSTSLLNKTIRTRTFRCQSCPVAESTDLPRPGPANSSGTNFQGTLSFNYRVNFRRSIQILTPIG